MIYDYLWYILSVKKSKGHLGFHIQNTFLAYLGGTKIRQIEVCEVP